MKACAPQNLDRITDFANRQAEEVSRITQAVDVFGALEQRDRGPNVLAGVDDAQERADRPGLVPNFYPSFRLESLEQFASDSLNASVP